MNMTEAALEARRRNARRSTGPRTEEGKERSRRNALKHGLAGNGVVLDERDAAEVERRVAAFAADLRPVGVTEAWLVRQAALATVRVERAQAEEAALLGRRRRVAVRDWDEARAREVEGLLARLGEEPAEAVAGLGRTAEGCGRLFERWAELAEALEAPGHWTAEDCFAAFRLLGRREPPSADDGGPHARLGLAALAQLPQVGPEGLAAYLLGPAAATLGPEAREEALRGRAPDPEAARECLRRFVAERLDELAERRDFLGEHFDGPDRAEAPERVLVDVGREAELRRRYEATHAQAFHRCLARLAEGRRRGLWAGAGAGAGEASAAGDAGDAGRFAAIPAASADPGPSPAAPNEPRSEPAVGQVMAAVAAAAPNEPKSERPGVASAAASAPATAAAAPNEPKSERPAATPAPATAVVAPNEPKPASPPRPYFPGVGPPPAA